MQNNYRRNFIHSEGSNVEGEGVLEMKRPYVFLSGFMDFHDKAFSINALHNILYCKQISRRFRKTY